MNGIVEAFDLMKSYRTDGGDVHALRGVNIAIERGEMVAVMGPSGCGKTTFVNLIAGFDKVDSGEILMNGNIVSQPGHDRMVVFQETALIPWQTTLENVCFGPLIRGEMITFDHKNE